MQPSHAAVIGYGFAGKSFHSYLIGLTPGLVLRGIASRDPATRERIVAERHCRAYESFDEVLADPNVDLVVLATPNDVHAEYSIRALQAGKNVVTDKPMCLSLAECDSMIAAAEQSDRLLTVFQNRRWDGDFLTLRQTMESGALGDVRWLEMAWHNFGPSGGWRGKVESGGGRFYDLGAHLVDQLMLLFPARPTKVYCRMHHDFPNSEVESEAFIVVEFEDGRTGVCDLSSLAAIKKPRFYARGTKGAFIKYGLDPQENAMKAGDIDAAREDPANYARLSDGKEETTIPTLPGRWRNFYENVAAVLNEGAEPAVTLSSVRRAVAVLDAALASARTGNTVTPDV